MNTVYPNIMNENEVNELITKAKNDDRLKIMNEKVDKMNLLLSRYTKVKKKNW